MDFNFPTNCTSESKLKHLIYHLALAGKEAPSDLKLFVYRGACNFSKISL